MGDGERYRDTDELRRQLADLKNQSETLLYTTHAGLEGYADLVDAEVIGIAREQAAHLRLLLDGAGDLAAIREAHQSLEALVFEIAEKLYGDPATPVPADAPAQ